MPSPEGRRLADLSLAVRESSLKRFRAVPSGCENWRLSKDSMTIADLAHHLIEADMWLFRKLQEPDLAPLIGESGQIEIASRDEYDKLLDELQSVGGERAKLLADLDDERLDQRLPDRRFGGAVPIWWIVVRGNLDHEIHHRGQLLAYLMVMQQDSK